MKDYDNLILTAGKRFTLFVSIFVICFLISSLIVGVITMKWGSGNPSALRIATVINDILMFIVPALAISLLVTRVPATFLNINVSPNAKILIMSILALFVSMPVMSYIIEWNASISLPENLSGIEDWMRESEKKAVDGTNALMGGNSVGSLIISILIIGIFTGLSEELFFRGAMQKLFLSSTRNHHVAIWITAIIFSVMHFQFYGFVPRVLLGAFFGYLVYWSGSIWISVIVHAANNTFVVITRWLFNNSIIATDPNQIESTETPHLILITLSVALTAIALAAIYFQSKKHRGS